MKIIRRFYATCATRKTIKSAHGFGAVFLFVLSTLIALPPTAHAASILLTDAQPLSLVLTAEQTKWLKNKKVLRVATKADWRPIDVTSGGGSFTGISGDYLRILTAKLGINVEVTQYPSNAEAIAALKSGKADILPSLAETPERLELLQFTRPYLDIPNAIFARTDTPVFDLAGEWAGIRVAHERGFATVARNKQGKPRATTLEFADTDATLTALSRGEADVYLGALPTTAATVERLLLSNVVVRGYIDSPFRFLRIGVAREQAELVPILNAAMASVTFSQAEEVRDRWMPERSALSYEQGALPLSSNQQKWLLNNNTVRVAYDPEMMPISFTGSNGKMTGLAVDYLSLVTKKLGLSVIQERRGTWSEILNAIKAGEVDVLIAAAMNQERLDYLDFAGPYLASPTVIVDASRDNSISEISNFIGKSLCVQADHFLVPDLKRRYPGINVVGFPTIEKSLQALLNKQCAAAIGNLYSIANQLETRYVGQLRISGNVANGDSVLYFATPKSKPELGQILSIAKSTISQSERNELRDRWLAVNYQPGYSGRSIATIGIPIALGLLSTLAVFFYLNRKLRLEIKRRNAILLQLANKRMEAEAATQAKARFLAAMSHEIRTPMQGIVGASDMLSRAGLSAAQDRLNALVQSASQVIVQLLSEILDDRRLEEGHIIPRLAPEDMVERIRGAVQLFEPNAKQGKIRLSFESSPMLARRYVADGTYLRQIISNFISNAIKYTPGGAVQVQMDARAVENNQHEITIAVIDTGKGMSAKDLENLFKPFVQGEAGHDADTAGSGLGLSICKRLADAMGAKLNVTSKLGLGTTMMLIIRLDLAVSEHDTTRVTTFGNMNDTSKLKRIEAPDSPASVAATSALNKQIHAATAARTGVMTSSTVGITAPSVTAASQTEPAILVGNNGREALPMAQLRILANEDDPLIRELLEDQFIALNVQADICADAVTGLEAWRNRDYDLIFTDNSLGSMTGAEFTAAVRAEERETGRPRTPIVGITGSIMVDEHTHCLAIGMEKILHKPIVLADLRNAISHYAKRKI